MNLSGTSTGQVKAVPISHSTDDRVKIFAKHFRSALTAALYASTASSPPIALSHSSASCLSWRSAGFGSRVSDVSKTPGCRSPRSGPFCTQGHDGISMELTPRIIANQLVESSLSYVKAREPGVRGDAKL